MNVKAVIVAPWKIIIGDVKEQDDKVVISNPLSFEEILTEKGLTIMPVPISLISPNKTLTINKNHLICDPYSPPREVEDMYVQANSNLIIPKNDFFKRG